jgi:hypothetical protein
MNLLVIFHTLLLCWANETIGKRLMYRAVGAHLSLLPEDVNYSAFKASFRGMLQEGRIMVDESTMKEAFEESRRFPERFPQIRYLVYHFYSRPRPLSWKVYNDLRKRFGSKTISFDEFASWWDDMKYLENFK